jgi:hypothetical protein
MIGPSRSALVRAEAVAGHVCNAVLRFYRS